MLSNFFPSFKYFVLSRGDVGTLLLIGQECQKGVKCSEELGSGIRYLILFLRLFFVKEKKAIDDMYVAITLINESS